MTKHINIKVAVRVCILLLLVMAGGAWFIINNETKNLEDELLSRGRIESMLGARITGRIIEEAVDNGVFSVKDVFDTEYVEIPGFDPPKYHTKYDAYLDKALLGIEDEFLKDDSVVFAVAVDKNGYLPTHNTRYQQPISGNAAKDRIGNRTKRIFNDPVGIKAARNNKEGFRQVYNRDTGETMWDISSPIFVKGKHWGGFRIGLSMTKTAQKISSLQQSLLLSLLIIVLITIVIIIFAVNKDLKQLILLTKEAEELAAGNVEKPITSTSQDEIGVLADVLERLRISLKLAMDRLKNS